MIEQIVGQHCVRCARIIESIAEGGFCPVCAQPVHCECANANVEAQPNHCEQCGSAIDDPNAVQERREVLRKIQLERMRQDGMRAKCGPDHGKRHTGARREFGQTAGAVGLMIIAFFIILEVFAFGIYLLFGWPTVRC